MDEHTSHTPLPDRTGGLLHEELSFRSGEATCAATLYWPAESDSEMPAVVLAAGISQTRRDGFPRFAESFAAAGMAALTFDFRHLGDSEGEPRQLIDFKRQREDLTAAIAFARSREGIDANRVAVWGFSFGGGHAVHVAAQDERLGAAIALCPFVDGLAFTLAGDVRNNVRLMGAAGRGVLTRRPVRIPVTGLQERCALFVQPEASRGFAAVRAEDSAWRNEMLAKPSQPAARIRPVRAAARVRCPLLVTLGLNDTMVPLRPIRRLAERAPQAELHQLPGGHFAGFLDDFDDVVDNQIAFLARHLAPQPPAG